MLGLGDKVRVCSVLPLLYDRLQVVVETVLDRPSCPGCGGPVESKGRYATRLTDLTCFGQSVDLLWRKRRWKCVTAGCEVKTWTENHEPIAVPRASMTSRAARWATVEVGRFGRPVSDIATVLGCNWHAVDATVARWGQALLDADVDRVTGTDAVGLDEILQARTGRFRTKGWATSIVDVRSGKLLDLVKGRTAQPSIDWFDAQPAEWIAGIRYGTLDMSGPYRKVFNHAFGSIDLIADPFHVVKLANEAVDEVRRRVQQETTGHRGGKGDPLYGARKLLVMADERLDEASHVKLASLLEAGDPYGEIRDSWHAKETIRTSYHITSHTEAAEFMTRLSAELADDSSLPTEINRLGRTLQTWTTEITNWHKARVTNGPTESINNLIKRIKRTAFGITRFKRLRIRALLYAGKPNWNLLNTITPQ
jgi:transposase